MTPRKNDMNKGAATGNSRQSTAAVTIEKVIFSAAVTFGIDFWSILIPRKCFGTSSLTK